MAHLWAEPNPPSLRDIPEHHRLAGPQTDWTEKISEPKDAVLQPPTPGPVGLGGKEKMGLLSDEEHDGKERDRDKPDTMKRSFSTSSSSSLSDSRSNKRNRTRRPHSPLTEAGNRPDSTGGVAGGTSIEHMRPRPGPKSKSRPILEPLKIQVEQYNDQDEGAQSRSRSPGSASPTSKTHHLTSHTHQHDGDFVDSPVSDSRPSSRMTNRSLEQDRDRDRGLGRPEGGEKQGLRNGVTPMDSTSASTSTSTATPLSVPGLGIDAGQAVGTTTGAGGHARTISAGSGKGIGMTGRQELVRRALADGPGHGHGHGHANGHHSGLSHGYVYPQGRTIESPSSHGSAGVPFPTMASNPTTSSLPSPRPRTDPNRRPPLDLSIDVDLASRPPVRTRRTTSSSRSPSSSRHGSTPHSPVLPNGSVGIGPALGIAKAGARLRAIVDDADQDAWASSGSASPPILGRQNRSRTSSLRSVPRRRMTDQGASGSSTPTATPITPGLSGSSGGTRPSGLNEGAVAARRRAKSLMSPASSRPDEREGGRGSSSRRVEMGTRKRSSTARVRTISDLKRERQREVEDGEARQGRRRGATVHFPPTPMEDGVQDQFMVETGTKDLDERFNGLSNELTSKGSRRRETSTARSTSDDNSSLAGLVGSDTEREGKRRRTRSKPSDESSDDERSRAVRSKKGKERARDRDRYRNGLEQVFETERSGHGDDADPLQTLLASVDINNALRLISQTTLIPGGRQAVLPGMGTGLAAEKSLTTGFTPMTPYKNGNSGRIGTSKGRPPEVFVAKAPPSVTASPAYVGGEDNRLHDTEAVKAKNKLIDRAGQKKNKVSVMIEESLKADGLDHSREKALFDGRAKIRSRRGTMIERDFVRPEAGDLSRTATAQSGDHGRAISSDEEDLDRVSSSIGHGGYEGTVRDDASNRSEPHSNGSVSQAFRPITPESRTESKPVEKSVNATPESTKRKRLSGLFHLRHSRSSSSSKWRSDPKAKDKIDPVRDSAAREAAERDAAEHEAKVQSVLLSLPSHPRCEALAYQARSHFQAYYGLMIRSLEDAAERPGQPYLRWNPLRVIRWRKQVLAEEKRRQNWDASVNEQIKSHHRLVQSTEDNGIPRDGWESQMPESIGRAGSRLQQMSKVISPPLRSATALSRALASDPQAAMALRKSATFKEWLVLPSEILAFIDCRGNVDYFVPATDKAQDVLRTAMASAPYPQSDGLPLSRATKSAFPVQQGLSPGSYGSSQGNISTVSFDSETLEHDQTEDGVQKRKSVTRRMWASTHLSRHQSNTSKESDHGERLAHVLKSPIDAIRRRVLHHESDIESDSERDLHNRDRSSHNRHGRLRKLAHPDRYQNGRGSLDAATSQAEDLAHDAAVSSRQSSIAPIAESLGGQTDPPGGGDFMDKKLGWSHIEGTAEVNSIVRELDNKPESDAQRDEEYTKHEALIRNTDTLLAKLFVDLAPMPITFSQTLEVFQQGIVHINRAAGLHVDAPEMPGELVARGKADFFVPTQPTSQSGKPMGSRTLSTRGSIQSATDVLPGLQEIRSRRSVTVTGGRSADPVAALEQTVNSLSTQFDAALPQAIALAQQQDDLQDKVSLMTTRAEQLRVKLDAEGNGKIRRQRAHLQSMRMPTERSIDHWYYELLRYLVNASLAVFRIGVYIKRFILWIAYLIQQIVMVAFRWVWAIVTSLIEVGRYILGGWVIRTILLLAIWSFFLLYFFVED